MLGIAQIISTQTRQPKPMNTEPKHIEDLIEHMPLPVCVLNSKRKLAITNKLCRSVFPNLTTGQDIAYFMREPAFLDAIAKIIDDGLSAEVGIEELGPPKRYFNVSLSAANQDNNNPNYVMLIFTDITLSKEDEKSRSAFVANVSHELRSPLTTLMGSIETLQGPAKNDDAAQVRFLGLMEQEAGRMKRIVDELLSLSKMEIQAHLHPQDSVDIHGVLKRTCGVLDDQAQKKNMSIILDVPEHIPAVRGERDQLIQVFHNLVDNAIKYGDENTDITIGASVGASHVELFVKNFGTVIPSEKLPRLTERFYRVDKSRSRDLGGTGLGLSIVKHIVNRHRGSIEIKSAKQDGTVFSISLPIAK